MHSNIKIACPLCLSILKNQGLRLACPKCKKHFSYREGIPSFAEVNPLFEGRFIEHIKPSKFEKSWFYPLLEKMDIGRRRISFLNKCLRLLNKNSLILDIGCGGGGSGLFLKRYGTVVGMDVSITSLRYARTIYENVLHASIDEIPFPSNYFNAIVTKDVLGHISFNDKEKAYSEMYRVLKPGGIMIHAAIETDSNNLWFKFAKKYPDLFKAYHIDKHSHLGLELPSVIIKRCRRLGFNVKKLDMIHALILYPSLLSAWFDNEYKNKSRVISILTEVSKSIQKIKEVNLAVNLSLGIVEKMINPILDVDQATGLLLCCEKLEKMKKKLSKRP